MAADSSKKSKLSLKKYSSESNSLKTDSLREPDSAAARETTFPEKVALPELGKGPNKVTELDLLQLCEDLWATRVVYHDCKSLPDLPDLPDLPHNEKTLFAEKVDAMQTEEEFVSKSFVSEHKASKRPLVPNPDTRCAKKAKSEVFQATVLVNDNYDNNLAKPGPSGIDFRCNSGAPTCVTSCPVCQFQFSHVSNQMDIDGHIAKCLSNIDDEFIW